MYNKKRTLTVINVLQFLSPNVLVSCSYTISKGRAIPPTFGNWIILLLHLGKSAVVSQHVFKLFRMTI